MHGAGLFFSIFALAACHTSTLVPADAAATDDVPEIADGRVVLDGGTLDAGGICGDGVVGGEEECDSGTTNSDTEADACRTSCQIAVCGDAVVDSGEECDDGNTRDGDGCSSFCEIRNACFHILRRDGDIARIQRFQVSEEGMLGADRGASTRAPLRTSRATPFPESITECANHVFAIAGSQIVRTTPTGTMFSDPVSAAPIAAVAVDCSLDGSTLFAVEATSDALSVSAFVVAEDGALGNARMLNVPVDVQDFVLLQAVPGGLEVYAPLNNSDPQVSVPLMLNVEEDSLSLASEHTVDGFALGVGWFDGRRVLSTLLGIEPCISIYDGSPAQPATELVRQVCLPPTTQSIGGALSQDGTTFYVPSGEAVWTVDVTDTPREPIEVARETSFNNLGVAVSRDGRFLVLQSGLFLQAYEIGASPSTLVLTDTVELDRIHGITVADCAL